jgi:hypothetical protein
VSDNVVSFPLDEAPQLLTLTCDCGGTTFFIRSDHKLVCAACDEMMDDDVTGIPWESVQTVYKEPRVIRDLATEDLAFRRVLAQANKDDTAALIVMNKDGGTHVWSDGWDGYPEIKAWFQERVDDLMEQLR